MREHFIRDAAEFLPAHTVSAERMPTALPGVIRLQESTAYGTRNLQCRTFYKAISRCEQPKPSAIQHGLSADEQAPSLIPGDAVFKLFANCVPVKGARRSTLCDLQNGSYCFLPNSLFYILTELAGCTIDEIKAYFDDAGKSGVIDQYFQFLLHNEFGFLSDEPERFPAIDFSFVRAEQITNAIIDVTPDSDHPYEDILRQLAALGCRALQIRVFEQMPLAAIEATLQMTRAHALKHIDLLIRYTPEMTDHALRNIVAQYPAISRILVHAAPVDKDIESSPGVVRVCLRQLVSDSAEHCGYVHPSFFAVNLDHFSEAQTANTCLNRKIAIDSTGAIKNCPALGTSFGHVRSTPIADVVALKQFQKLWAVRKDDIQVCKSCEFRYICSDCRAILNDSSDILSKPARCTYDPFTASWTE